MLVDANLLLHAVDETTEQHTAAASWWTGALNGTQRVGLPWQSIGAFLRITTHPRVATTPLSAPEAWSHVASWLAAGPVWVPPTTTRTAAILGQLIADSGATGNLIPDAQLAAIAVEHGLTVMSADTDFARFDVAWRNPLAS